MDSLFSQLPHKRHPQEVAYVGDGLKICPGLPPGWVRDLAGALPGGLVEKQEDLFHVCHLFLVLLRHERFLVCFVHLLQLRQLPALPQKLLRRAAPSQKFRVTMFAGRQKTNQCQCLATRGFLVVCDSVGGSTVKEARARPVSSEVSVLDAAASSACTATTPLVSLGVIQLQGFGGRLEDLGGGFSLFRFCASFSRRARISAGVLFRFSTGFGASTTRRPDIDAEAQIQQVMSISRCSKPVQEDHNLFN